MKKKLVSKNKNVFRENNWIRVILSKNCFGVDEKNDLLKKSFLRILPFN